jgi:hypothetical protein
MTDSFHSQIEREHRKQLMVRKMKAYHTGKLRRLRKETNVLQEGKRIESYR